MKKLFMAVIALMMTISASAQFYIYFSDGTVAKVDSISMVAPAVKGQFSVSPTKQVIFSSGNLQYHPQNDEWRFAENQTDYIGEDNQYIAVDYDGWIDLFGWSGSTSAAKFGVSSSINYDDYAGDFVDWGVNQIGEDAPNTWRTLLTEEWVYLLENRPYANLLYGMAQVNGVNGLILLPDDWTCPAEITFRSGIPLEQDGNTVYQLVDQSEWSIIEQTGAVFLPASGERYGKELLYLNDVGHYWSSTDADSCNAFRMYFFTGLGIKPENGAIVPQSANHRFYGWAVRLAKDVQ